MESVRLAGPDGTELDIFTHTITWLDRNRLPIETITRIQGPLRSDGVVLPPGEILVDAYDSSGSVEATLVYASIGSRRQLVRIQSMKPLRGRALKVKDVHTFPIAQVGREFGVLLDDMRAGAAGIDESLGPVAAAVAPKPAGRKPVTDELLLTIAEMYNRQQGVPGAYWLMALSLEQSGALGSKSFSEGYLRQLVRKARERGFLEATTPGRKNWQLTSEAKELLRNLPNPDQLGGDDRHGNSD
jgi:hypothetical protein